MPLKDVMKSMKTSEHEDVYQHSLHKVVFLVFLRHFGCVFCRESLMELNERKEDMKARNIELIFVHMTDQKLANGYFVKYGFENVLAVSDPDCKFYQEFGLIKGRFNQLFGLRTMVRGFEVTASKGIFPALTQLGDGYQMPGIFIIKNGMVTNSFIHQYAADKPDYDSLIALSSN